MIEEMDADKYKLLQPGFKYDYNFLMDHKWEAEMQVKFINGFEKTWYMGYSPLYYIREEIKHLNDAIELQRALQGQDDTPPDEDN